MKVSLLCANYNNGRFLRAFLDSVVESTYVIDELVFVDDGSTDNSGSIAANFSKIQRSFYVLKKRNGGLASARNFGFQKARGQYICYIDSDDYIENN